MRRTAATLIVAMAGAGCQGTAGPPEATADTPYTIERHREAFALSGDGSVTVSNPLGDLRLRSAKGGEPLFAAVIQRLRGEQRPVAFDIDASDGNTTIAVKAARDFDGRVDAVLLVPKGVRIDARTTFGLLEVRVASRRVDAASDTGEIRIRTDGAVVAESRSGKVSLSLQDAAGWDTASTLVSRDGDVTVFTPVVADVSFDLAGSAIDNQLPAGAPAVIEQGERSLRGRLNTGTLSVRALAPNGTVVLIGF